MKNYTPLLTLLLITLISVFSALAQESIKLRFQESLASMPAGERFTSAKCGFTITLPQKPTESNADEPGIRGVSFTWELKEGTIIVKCVEYVNGVVFATESDREQFLKGYISVFKKSDIVESLTETPYTLGEFKGKTYSFVMLGKAQVRLIMAGKKSFEIMAVADPHLPGSDNLLFKAANSFSLVPSPAKQ